MTYSSATVQRPIDAIVAFARRRPEAALAGVLGFHLVIWTVLPILICPNLQLDLAEDLALGKEWQLGYWKHPPLPWWIADLSYRIVGDERVVYLLGPLSAVLCMYVVWRLARELVEPPVALVAVLALEGIHFFNFSVPKFAHDHTLMVLWPLCALFFYHGIARGRPGDWLLAGIALAGCLWSKYTTFAFAATLGLILLFDPLARRAWRTPGPYLMAVAFLALAAPHLWWLVDSGFQPFQYVSVRAVSATRWYQYLTFPAIWIASQFLLLLPAIGLVAILLYPRPRATAPRDGNGFARRYVAAVALGPFLVTTVVSLLLGRLPITMWGFALWSFAPLALLMWIVPHDDPGRLRKFALAFIAVTLVYPAAYVTVEIGEPFLHDRPKATQFPGEIVADAITRAWKETYGTPLVYAGGTELAVNNLAVYSPDHPHVLPHGESKLAPWVDMSDLRRRGAVLVWEEGHFDARLDAWRKTFSDFEVQPTLVLARQTWHPVKPARIVYAFVPPRP